MEPAGGEEGGVIDGVMMNEIYERCAKYPAFSAVQPKRGMGRQYEVC
jgi:hypothetical protein